LISSIISYNDIFSYFHNPKMKQCTAGPPKNYKSCFSPYKNHFVFNIIQVVIPVKNYKDKPLLW